MRNLRLSFAVLVTAATLCADPALVSAQCNWAGDPVCSPGTGGPFQTCSRAVVPTDGCFLSADGGMGTSCTYMSMSSTQTLRAVQTMTATRPSAFCEWRCGTATCLVRLSDGLPVELMNFRVE